MLIIQIFITQFLINRVELKGNIYICAKNRWYQFLINRVELKVAGFDLINTII